jgi:dihydropteroate synthase
VKKKTAVMGILNMTPDSFSDGGDCFDIQSAVDHALFMKRSGADIIDVGGESTRPGAAEIDCETEWNRIGDAVSLLANKYNLKVSVDTRHPETAERALKAGAKIINCVESSKALQMCNIVNTFGYYSVEIILPIESIETLEENGWPIAAERIYFDPMIGFGSETPNDDIKKLLHAVEVAKKYRVLVGVSRKRFIRFLSGVDSPKDTKKANVEAALWCARNGIQAVRVHDVRETALALGIHESGFEFRNATLKDAESIFALIHLNRDQLVPRSMGNIVENIDRFTVAVSGKDIIGCVAYQTHPEIGDPLAATVEIQSLAVRSPYRRHGIGRMLVEMAISSIEKFSPKEAIVLTFAPEFFTSLGFKEVSKTKVMHKLYTGCINCTKHTNPFTCPEIAMVREI